MFLTAMSQKLAKHEHFSCRAVSIMIVMFVKLTNLYMCGKRRKQWCRSNVFIKKKKLLGGGGRWLVYGNYFVFCHFVSP